MNAVLSVPRPPGSARDPLRVLHVYAGNRFGGIERFLVTLAQSGAAHGLSSRFALCFEGILARELREAGATVDILGDVRVRYPWSVHRARRRLRGILAAEQQDAVVSHACWPFALFAPVAKAQRIPLVYWSHDAPRGEHWVERWAARCAPDLVIANSLYTGRAVEALFAGTPREVVYYPSPAPADGAAPEARSRVRASLHAADDEVVIMIAARVEPLKGHAVLVEALGRMRPDLPRWVVWMVGGTSTPEEQAHLDRVLARARELGVADRVRHLGHRGDVADLLAASDIYCQPNTGPETFGLSFIEALYARRPVVTSAIGGALEIVDPSCGVLTAPGDAAALAAALEGLVEDGRRRAELGAAGPARALSLCDGATQIELTRAVLGRLRGDHA